MLTEAQFDIVARQTRRRVGMVIPPEKLAATDARLNPLARREGFACAGELIATTQDRDDVAIWESIADALLNGDTIFFRDYWRPEASIAYQCRTEEGPVDYVPATPDLDPGYHTGLSLLAAIDVVERVGGAKPYLE